MNENKRYIEEDEIDLRELWKTIVKRKVFILIFTAIVTLGAVVFAFSKTPIYEVRAIVEIGSIMHNNNNNNNNSPIENINNLVKKLQIVYINNASKTSQTTVKNISSVKSTTNLMEIIIHSTSNDKAVKKLNQIIDDVKEKHQKIIDNTTSIYLLFSFIYFTL